MEGGLAPYSSSMAPSGSYILIIVSQPVTDDHKQLILDRLNKGLLSWDVDATGCDLTGLESVCSSINSKRLNDSDVLIQYSTESLGVEVLVSPTVSTLKQCVKNLFSTSTGHKHLIHAGYTFAGSGSWVLQNGTFSFDEFLEIFQQADVQSQKRCNINVHCAEVGPWNSVSLSKDIFTKVANVFFNPSGKVSSVPGSEHLIDCLKRVLSSQALEEIMEASSLVGNIRFNRPTLYMFPAGQGDCALFGINGFNMLIDGGFSRKPCSWEFIRHLDRLDAVLVTRLCENNVCGMSTLMKRKSLNNTYPQIGYVFCNIAEDNISSNNEIMKTKDDLTISVVGEGHTFIQTLNELKLKPHQCWRDSSVEPFVLYHKVGHGTLEMHVLSPPKDSKEMKDFISEWSSYKETFSSIKSGLKAKSVEYAIPLSHATSICAVLIWRPADPKDTITRILFPGSAPQTKIFESLEKLKTLDVLKQPIVTKSSLGTIAVSKSVSKVETVNRASLPNRRNTASPALSVSSVASRNGDIGGVKKEVKKVIKEVKKDNKDIIKKEVKKDIKKSTITKDVKKTESTIKKDAFIKKDPISKDVKKVVKKDSKDVKVPMDKKEVKSAPKKVESTVSKPVSEVKKTATTAVKKTATAAKKDAAKVTSQTKNIEARKSAPAKLSEPKAAKDVSNKKVAEAKAVPKTKLKVATSTPKTSSPKPKPASVPKPGSKMTKAVAASSIVASAVAVTVAAFELNEKKEELVDDLEPENISEKEAEVLEDLKETVPAEKSEEVNVSPLPPEALSPTPSESISLTPSDTLSSAPLETVSPTPPLANEPMSIEEKEVNEIKDIEQDIEVYEADVPEEAAGTLVTDEKPVDEVNDIELELAKRQKNDDMMSMSFVGLQNENESVDIEDVIEKAEAASEQFSAVNSQVMEADPIQKFDEDKEAESMKQMESIEKTEQKFNEEMESENLVESVKENANIEDIKEKDIDDQLAHLSMEGSFCAGMSSCEQENVAVSEMEKVTVTNDESIDIYGIQKEENIKLEEKEEIIETQEKEEIIETQEKEEIIETQEKEEIIETQEKEEIIETQEKEEIIETQEKEEVIETEEKHDTQMKENLQDIEVENLSSYNEAEAVGLNVDEQNKDMESFDQHGVDTTYNNSEKSIDNKLEENSIYEEQDNFADEEQEKEVIFEKCRKVEAVIVESNITQDNKYLEGQEYKNQLDDVQRMEASLNQRMSNQDFDIAQNIIDDAEMQETSVDEPEEIVRKESAVSITLNDEELGATYEDSLRRKSCTESEDDVDIQNYMAADRRDSFEQDKLGTRRDSDSDNEDVVKSPTPHAVVDYEGNMDEAMKTAEIPVEAEDIDFIQQKDVTYITEKEDFDEKDRDSVEDQDEGSDGEMIRHPTPPEVNYTEEEMRDPIGQHYITAPGMKSQVSGITEQPLYEESEDVGSDRSVSPVIEQPVFGNVVQADFPELVTVSGGTTPSEPQSPKTAFGTNKFASENAVMDALSEHDCSESSAHSPSCHDGTTFEMPVSEEALDTHTIDIHQENMPSDVSIQNGDVELPLSNVDKIPDDHNATIDRAPIFQDEKDSICLAENDVPSDEESFSQNEQSETRSEKSDGPDEKSDIHRDDKSDNQHDGKSDMMDDDQLERSDMNDGDDDQPEFHDDNKQDDYGGKGASDYDMQEGTRSHDLNNQPCDTREGNDYEMQYDHYEIKDDFQSSNVIETQNDFSVRKESPVHSKDLEDSYPDDKQSYEIESSADFSTQISEPKQTLEKSALFNNEETNVGYEVSGKDNCEEITQQENSKIFSGEVPTNFNIPSGFEDVEKTEMLDSYASNLKPDINELRSSPSGIKVESGEDAVEAVHSSPSFMSDIDQHEDPVMGKQEESLENDGYYEDLGKGTIENVEDSVDIDAYKHEETRIIHQNEDEREDQAVVQDLLPTVTDEFPLANAPDAFTVPDSVEHTEDIISHAEKFSNYENSMTEMTEARQYEPLSKYEENVHTSNLAYNESSLITNMVSRKSEPEVSVSPIPISGDTNLNLNETSGFATSGIIEQAMVQQNESYEGIESKQSTDFDSRSNVAGDEFENKYVYSTSEFSGGIQGFDESKFTSSEIIEQSTYEESYGANKITSTSETKTEYSQSFEVQDIPEQDSILGSASEHASTFGAINGNEQTAWSHSASECTTKYLPETTFSETHMTYDATSEQETSYIINSRFQSDSPEDNIMRSDSSPDVPPYPVDSAGHLTDLKHLVSDESLNQTKADYPNMNLPHVGVAPLSPNKMLNTNRDNSYPVSSEDEDSSSMPGTVSPYAYTNKAYAKEEEDIDGNHIYEESITTEKTSEIMEFDGNNPPITTQMNYSQGYQEMQYSGETNYDFRLEEWGKPMGLPTPPDSTQKTVLKKTEKSSMKTLNKSAADTNGKAYSPTVASKLSSPLKKPKPKATKESSSSPVYVDLAYVPHHGDPQYCDVEFFKKIRARYYVFSGINPSKEVLNALLEAKKSWKEDLEVTIIPTYETDTLGYWMAQNQDDLAEYSIEVAPSASRCTVNLQDHETSCAAYRLEF